MHDFFSGSAGLESRMACFFFASLYDLCIYEMLPPLSDASIYPRLQQPSKPRHVLAYFCRRWMLSDLKSVVDVGSGEVVQVLKASTVRLFCAEHKSGLAFHLGGWSSCLSGPKFKFLKGSLYLLPCQPLSPMADLSLSHCVCVVGWLRQDPA